MPHPFERLPRESEKAFAAFSLYLSQGAERSTREVGKQLGKSEGLIERWAAKFDWRSRVAAHTAHLAMVEREAIEARPISCVQAPATLRSKHCGGQRS